MLGTMFGFRNKNFQILHKSPCKSMKHNNNVLKIFIYRLRYKEK